MQIRENTKKFYIKFLTEVANQVGEFNIRNIIAEHRVDVKFMGFLKKEGYTLATSNGGNIVTVNPNMFLIPENVANDYITYRNKMEADYRKRVGENSSSQSLSQIPQAHYPPEIQKIVSRVMDETKRKIAKEAAEYAEWAVAHNRPIEETVYKLLSL